jgi:hypothetical protein
MKSTDEYFRIIWVGRREIPVQPGRRAIVDLYVREGFPLAPFTLVDETLLEEWAAFVAAHPTQGAAMDEGGGGMRGR